VLAGGWVVARMAYQPCRLTVAGNPSRHIHYGVVKLLALKARRERQRRIAAQVASPGRLNADHSPDHNSTRQTASLSDLAEGIMPGQPRHAATCPLLRAGDHEAVRPGAAAGRVILPGPVSAELSYPPGRRVETMGCPSWGLRSAPLIQGPGKVT
jgi:hypothetical protein